MARPVNAEAFDKLHWLLVAKGFNWQELNIYFSARGGMVERNGGIESPNRTSLYVGTYYYRFVDLKAGPDNQQGGGWWLDLDQLTKIMAACPSRGLNLSQMARAFLAVPWEWNPCRWDRSGRGRQAARCLRGPRTPGRVREALHCKHVGRWGRELPGQSQCHPTLHSGHATRLEPSAVPYFGASCLRIRKGLSGSDSRLD
jgi:hypothetical protein